MSTFVCLCVCFFMKGIQASDRSPRHCRNTQREASDSRARVTLSL
jgi:hypothetical protein